MTNFLHSLWRHRWFRACVWGMVAVIVALVSIRQYIDWSGARKWDDFRARLAGEGESLDIRKTAPPDVPDDQNFCAIPALKDLPLWPADDNDKSEFGLKRKRLMDAAVPMGKPTDSPNFVPRPKAYAGADMGKRADIAAWADWFRYMQLLPPVKGSEEPARQVLAALSKSDGLVRELEQGLDRPDSQWTPTLKTRPLPEPLFTMRIDYYNPIQAISSALCFRSIVSARAGDAAEAHDALLVAVRLNQATMKEPGYISVLISVGLSNIISGAAWELCAAHAGTAEQFRRLQTALEQLDFRRCLLNAEHGELAFSADTARFLANSKNPWSWFPFATTPTLSSSGIIKTGLNSIPRGWLGLNTALAEQWLLEYSIEPLRDEGLKALLDKQKELEVLVNRRTANPLLHSYELLALMGATNERSISERTIYAQCLVNEAIAACALERYRIEHGFYPDTLEAANHPGEPGIPVDVISGKPMGYRKTADGMYALWCVGFDGKNDGGKRNQDPSHPDYTNFASPDYKGDWVWSFRPN